MEKILDITLWLAGIGHFVVLLAGIQVPVRFKWKEELPRLSAMNRKLMWVYSAYIFFIIASFGTLTLVFHDEFLAGSPVALGLALVIALMWTGRLMIDLVYYKHSDWPQGKGFVIGHILLTTLFIAVAATYILLLIQHLVLS